MSAAPLLTPFKKIMMEVVSGPLQGRTFNFAKPMITIGRGPENDLVIEQDSKISRMHIEIRQTDHFVTVHNVTEKNTALLNGLLIKSANIEGSARLLIGETEMLIHVESNQLGGNQALPATVQGSASIHQLQVINHQLQAGASSQAQAPSLKTNNLPGQNFGMAQVGKGNFRPAPGAKNQESPKILFYALVGVILIAGAYLTSQTVAKHRRSLQIKTNEEVEAEVKLSKETVEDITKKFQEDGVDGRSYQTAQQQYVRGYRDYNQGQYARAIHELSAAVTYYPQHKLAQRYLSLAQKKLDEMVKAEFELGQKYRGQQSYRRCAASFKKVITLLDDPDDKISKDAEKILQECELQQREHY